VSEELKTRLRDRLEDFVDTFVVAGAKQADVFDAIIEEVRNLRAALDRDPDPAEDDSVAVDEPANDWPGADNY
jgi:hypothetical protein